MNIKGYISVNWLLNMLLESKVSVESWKKIYDRQFFTEKIMS